MVQKKGNGGRKHTTASTLSEPLRETGRDDYVSSYYKIKVSEKKKILSGVNCNLMVF